MKIYHWPIVVALANAIAGEAVAVAETKEDAIELIAQDAIKRILVTRRHKELYSGESMWILELKNELQESDVDIYEPPLGFAIDGSA